MILGQANVEYPVGVQTTLPTRTPATIETVFEDEELLGTPTSTRLTSFPTGHFLDLYYD